MLSSLLLALALVTAADPPAQAAQASTAVPATTPVPGTSPAEATPAASPAPTPVVVVAENPAVTKRAKDWFHRVQTGNIDRTQLGAAMNLAMTADSIKQGVAQLGPLGAPQSFTYVKTLLSADFSTAVYALTFASGKLLWTFTLDHKGFIAGFYLRPEGTI
jgi:hypothetical protein